MHDPVATRDETILVVPVYSQLANLAFALRREVFMLEQGVSHADEYDDLDRDCTHLVTVLTGEVVATLRIVWLPDYAKIGRFAVRQSLRNQGLGSRLFAAALQHIQSVARAADSGHARIGLEAQIDRIAFYERFGFRAYGDEYLDAGILHRKMKNDG